MKLNCQPYYIIKDDKWYNDEVSNNDANLH